MTSVSWLLAGVLVAGNPPAGAPAPGRTLVVALGTYEGAEQRVRARADREAKNTATILSHAEVIAKLIGDLPGDEPPTDSFSALLDRARDLEAEFESDRAAEVYQQIIAGFDHALRPTGPERAATAQALHELAASLAANGHPDDAAERARQAARRFPDHPPDPLRQPPALMKLFDVANEEILAAPTGKVVVTSVQEGEVFLDGRSLGNSRGRVVRSLPVGRYRAWLVTEAGISLPHPLLIEAGVESELTIDAALDRCLQLAPILTLTCEERWQRDLFALVRAVGAERGVGVPPEGYAPQDSSAFTDGALIVSADSLPAGLAEPGPEINEPGGTEIPLPVFSPLYLIPLGGGQFAQERYLFGAAYLAVEIGLIVWAVVAAVGYGNVVRSGAIEPEPAARLQRNLAIGVSVSFAAATVIEAVIVGLVIGE